MVKVHLLGRYRSGFFLQLKFFLRLSIPFSSFSWLLWLTLWLCRISCTFYYPALQDHTISLFVVNPSHSYIFPLCVALVDVLIKVETITFCSCSLVISFLFFDIQHVACNRLIDLLFNCAVRICAVRIFHIDAIDAVDGFFLVPNQNSLLLSHPFANICFFSGSTQFKNQFVVDWGKVLKPESMLVIMVLSNSVLFSVWLWVIAGILLPHNLVRVVVIIFHVIYLFGLSVKLFLFPYFTQKLFCFLCIRLLVCPCAFYSILLLQFSFVILESLVLIVLIDTVSVSFKSPFCRPYLLIYVFKLYCQICSLFCLIFSSQCIPVFSLLSTFACRRNFFTCPASLIFNPVLFLFEFLREISNISQAYFAPA